MQVLRDRAARAGRVERIVGGNEFDVSAQRGGAGVAGDRGRSGDVGPGGGACGAQREIRAGGLAAADGDLPRLGCESAALDADLVISGHHVDSAVAPAGGVHHVDEVLLGVSGVDLRGAERRGGGHGSRERAGSGDGAPVGGGKTRSVQHRERDRKRLHVV